MQLAKCALRRRLAQCAAIGVGLTIAAGLGVPAASAQPIGPGDDPSLGPVSEVSSLDPVVESGTFASAADARDFAPGYIISDYAFFNGAAMSEAEIQRFLDTRVSGSCLNANCLAQFRMTTPNREVTPRCAGYAGAANESAARILYKIQSSCGVSAKVLLVTLQKETSLVTLRAPEAWRIERAMGYYCPDDPTRPGWCHPDFAGFFNQVYNAAAQFQRYRLSPTSFNFRPGVFDIKYHPNSACGTQRVSIVNQATAGLYNYTPYTPNGAALANLYGTGDGCSSYGNRNFWRMYFDWFGSPTTLVPSGVSTARLAGDNRWATAASVSRSAYPNGATTVFIAVGTDFADGLAAAPAAALVDAPLLLVDRTSVPAATEVELQRLRPQSVVMTGGTGVVTSEVEARIRQLLPSANITRLHGIDRYRTATAIADARFSSGASTIFLATGGDFADALSASAAAGALGAPVLLVPPGAATLPTDVPALLTKLGVTRVVIAGGAAAVSSGVEVAVSQVPGVKEVRRLGGANRYDTATRINEFAFPAASRAFIASGADFPDALSAAAAAGAVGAPLHLSNGVCTNTPSLQHIVNAKVTTVTFVGGAGVLAPTVTEFMTCG